MVSMYMELFKSGKCITVDDIDKEISIEEVKASDEYTKDIYPKYIHIMGKRLRAAIVRKYIVIEPTEGDIMIYLTQEVFDKLINFDSNVWLDDYDRTKITFAELVMDDVARSKLSPLCLSYKEKEFNKIIDQCCEMKAVPEAAEKIYNKRRDLILSYANIILNAHDE